MSNFDLHFQVFSNSPVPSVIPRMSVREHTVFVEGLMSGSIFTSLHVHEADKVAGDLPAIFCLLADGVLKNAPQDFLDEIGVLWEFTKDRLAKVKKGSKTDTIYPTFSSAHVCPKADWTLVCDVVKAMKSQSSLITVGGS